MNIYVGVVHGFHDEISVAATKLADAKAAFVKAMHVDAITDFYFWKPTTVNKKRAYKLLCYNSGMQLYGKNCHGRETLLGWIIITELIGGER